MHERRPATRRALRADARRNVELIRRAALEVFRTRGLDAPLEEVAERAGVSIGTLYNRFGGREGLLDAVLTDFAQERLRTNIATAQAEREPWARFKAFLEGVCEFQSVSPKLGKGASMRYREVAKELAVSETTIQIGEELLNTAKRAGSIRSDFTRDDLHRLIWSQGSLVRDGVGEDGWRRSIRLSLDGVRTRTTANLDYQ